MDIIPNECVYHILEQMSYMQRVKISRVCKIWWLLCSLLNRQPKRYCLWKSINNVNSNETSQIIMNQERQEIIIVNLQGYCFNVSIYDMKCYLIQSYVLESDNEYSLSSIDFDHSNGNLITSGEHIKIFNEKRLIKILYEGVEPNFLYHPRKVIVNSKTGNLLVLDFYSNKHLHTNQDRLKLFDNDGSHDLNQLTHIGHSNINGIELNQRTGDIIISYGIRFDIRVYTSDVKLKGKLDEPKYLVGHSDKQKLCIKDVAIDYGTNNIYIFDSLNQIISIFDSGGKLYISFEVDEPRIPELEYCSICEFYSENECPCNGECCGGGGCYRCYPMDVGILVNHTTKEIVVMTNKNTLKIFRPIFLI